MTHTQTELIAAARSNADAMDEVTKTEIAAIEEEITDTERRQKVTEENCDMLKAGMIEEYQYTIRRLKQRLAILRPEPKPSVAEKQAQPGASVSLAHPSVEDRAAGFTGTDRKAA